VFVKQENDSSTYEVAKLGKKWNKIRLTKKKDW
jgi:hypothetical protein